MKIYTGSFLEPEFNNHMKEVWGIENFDIIVQNPPYNPNSLWKKFIEKAIDLLTDDGYIVVIHPADWRESSRHNNLCIHLKKHILELHINDFEIWKNQKVATRTDWYLYSKNEVKNTKVYYSNGNFENIVFNEQQILRISSRSIPYSILKKITKNDYNNGIIMQGRTGYHPLYKKHDQINGIYKQCGTEGKGNNWTKNDFSLTTTINENQKLNKVVIAYSGKPRAVYFSSSDNIGVVRANYWLTDNKSLPVLLNSNMFWKIACSVVDPDKNQYKPYGTMSGIPSWLLKSLYFEELTATTEEELYKHYNLTQEEINWINS
jgi:hypothetical protein